LAKKSRVWDGTAWQELASAQTDLTAYSTTAQINSLLSGSIKQVLSTTKTDTFSASVAAGANTAITGLSVTITPSSATSKILVTYMVNGSLNLAGGASGNNGILTTLKRGATSIGVGNAAGSRQQVSATMGGEIGSAALSNLSGMTFLDSPATTSATTYSVNISHTSGAAQTMYVNRTSTDPDSSNYHRSISTITVMEVLV
jgi:hypothetical protein